MRGDREATQLIPLITNLLWLVGLSWHRQTYDNDRRLVLLFWILFIHILIYKALGKAAVHYDGPPLHVVCRGIKRMAFTWDWFRWTSYMIRHDSSKLGIRPRKLKRLCKDTNEYTHVVKPYSNCESCLDAEYPLDSWLRLCYLPPISTGLAIELLILPLSRLQL